MLRVGVLGGVECWVLGVGLLGYWCVERWGVGCRGVLGVGVLDV